MSGEKANAKKLLRLGALQTKKDLSLEYIEKSDRAIYQNMVDLAQYQKAKALFCFIGREDEIDTRAIIEHALQSGKQVGVPRIVSPGVMEVLAIDCLEGLIRNKYGILEPPDGNHLILPEEIDFAIVPCLACDKAGIRLGYGGGYYDRYLAGTRMKKAALCRKELLVGTVPAEAWDVRMDFVITEEEIIQID